MTLIDKVIQQLQIIYELDPDRLDLPVFDARIDQLDNALSVPLEVETLSALSDANVSNEVEMVACLHGTFLELIQRLRSIRACLDLVVTSREWLISDRKARYGFIAPTEPRSITDALHLISLRMFRIQGRVPTGPCYSKAWAEAFGKRHGLGIQRPWTLDSCAKLLGVSRERVRQVQDEAAWECAARNWGRPEVLERLSDEVANTRGDESLVNVNGVALPRVGGIRILRAFGYDNQEFQGQLSLEEELEVRGVRLAAVRQVAYSETEKTGFVTLGELRHHIVEQFPEISDELMGQVVDEVVEYGDLPYEYVYVEGSNGSSMRLWLEKLLQTLGPQLVDEAIRAVHRHFKAVRPRLAFPPRTVLESFIERHPSFRVAEGVVSLTTPTTRTLTGVEKWMHNTILDCTGQVISRTELWSRGREGKVKGGTLMRYAGYSLYFKPLPGGLVTITGLNPDEVMRELARSRAGAIKVATRIIRVDVAGGAVSVLVEVGNDLLDGGVLGSKSEMRSMFGGQRFKALVDGEHRGNVDWSGNSIYGFTSALQTLGVQPGDRVRFVFQIAEGAMEVEQVVE